ncbi:MAG: acetoacetate--CoA ligase [Alphaproteobacteria bacterium]|nr:acetoacetate--CoA ligase [Alphaproteobacteria bacterium]
MTILWQPDAARIARAEITGLARRAEAVAGRALPSYAELHAWSLEAPEAFWTLVWEENGVIGARGAAALAEGGRMPGARFFPEARLNYAQTLMRPRLDDAEAIVFRSETGRTERWSYGELREAVGRAQGALRAAGVGPGDRVAAYMPNCPETVIAMLAATGLGAVFSSASPDFGVRGVLDRFGQIEPAVLIACDGYHYGGKDFDQLPKLAEVVAGLPGLRATLVVPFLTGAERDLSAIPAATSWTAALASAPKAPPVFEPVAFDHPLFIMFSSGTTGVPKCIVHGHGGTLLQHLKEHRYHCDIRPGDRVFYFTTCGWMMWNWLVSALAREAVLMLFDGSPFHPSGEVLFDYAQAEAITFFGTSAKWIDAVKKAGLRPAETHDLSSVRAIASTGSPLVPESFDYVYEAIKPDVHLASISGGTDILSCFVLGNPVLPVHRGEIQCAGLGMAVEAWDEEGRPVTGEKGELVCTRPFPSMPVGFWNDPDGAKYRAAYFERFPGVWVHGDFVERTRAGGFIIYGRSDATLNPGGVRIGTAEIYRQVEQLEEVVESIVVGREVDGDVEVVLFVVLRPGVALDTGLEKRIRTQIRQNATPRHVPARILQVPDIPRTKSGKIVELAVREAIHGRPVKNVEALANPEALEAFRTHPGLAG